MLANREDHWRGGAPGQLPRAPPGEDKIEPSGSPLQVNSKLDGFRTITMSEQTYDRIGRGYASKRLADPRLAREIGHALGEARLIVNVGAGSGSYEPTDRFVVAVEPAATMIRQRPATAAPALRGYAHALPFGEGTFDAALAILTIHHWPDWRAGLREMARVSRDRMVLFTWDPTSDGFWLRDYLPDLLERDRGKFPEPVSIAAYLGGAEVRPVPIPHDCSDGFMGAYWRRPLAYLDPNARAAISTLASGSSAAGLDRLAEDVADGTWIRKYADIVKREVLDVGYRLIVSDAPSNPTLQRTWASLTLGPGR
jgi:SAM-dependent methyltransferase